MAEVRLTTPIKNEDITSLQLGDTVYITGAMYTARDEAHIHTLDLSLRRGKGRTVGYPNTDELLHQLLRTRTAEAHQPPLPRDVLDHDVVVEKNVPSHPTGNYLVRAPPSQKKQVILVHRDKSQIHDAANGRQNNRRRPLARRQTTHIIGGHPLHEIQPIAPA